MAPALTPREFKAWVGEAIAPCADQWDREERLPDGLLRELAGSGFPGAAIPRDYGGGGLDGLAFGALCETLGGG
ncbi:MAG: acyl-CoA dehydrogenase family protein, partial [Pseudomonadota bacterium]|nr:acyl-CoA dehydrogenase family protein [Pseudomonadota bacterium]